MADAKDLIQIKLNPPDLIQRMAQYPKELDKEMKRTGEEALLHVQASVPPYPQQPAGSSYKRTGTLGRSLGASMSGAVAGKADVQRVRRLGQGRYEARFGTRLQYAPDVIGTNTQKPLFKRIGWYTMQKVKELANDGVVKIYDKMADRMVKFLGG